MKTGGCIAVSESPWFTDERPDEINDFWMNAYPEIDTIPNQVAKIHKARYLPVATFILSESCWTEHFFVPNSKVQEIFLNKHAGNKSAEEFIASEKYEAELYHKYKEYYGYTFFIAKKIGLNECSEEQTLKAWKRMSNQSERQLGAYIALFYGEFFRRIASFG